MQNIRTSLVLGGFISPPALYPTNMPPHQMLWNWYTIDACFISSDWHVTTRGGFAASCLGAWGLVMVLEFLRRLTQEYDIWLVKKRVLAQPSAAGFGKNGTQTNPTMMMRAAASLSGLGNKTEVMEGRRFKPTASEQAIRASLYAMQVVLAYFVMLLAMSFNGFVLLCMFVGAYTGFFASHWVHFGDE